MGVVFTKTTNGHDEVAQRSGDLTPRARRLLILIDGKRSVDELRDLVAADDLTHTLGALEELGLIEVKAVVQSGGIATPPDGALPAIAAFRELPDDRDPRDLDKARNYMINTLRSYCALYGPITLMTIIGEARSHEELRSHFGQWYNMIVGSREGRRCAEDLRQNLLKVL